MTVRIVLLPRYANYWLALAAVASLLLSGCSKSGGSGSVIEFTPAAMKSLPALRSSVFVEGMSEQALTAYRRLEH